MERWMCLSYACGCQDVGRSSVVLLSCTEYLHTPPFIPSRRRSLALVTLAFSLAVIIGINVKVEYENTGSRVLLLQMRI